ncbi:MAG: EpsG family protein, partial [Erysipelotrichaceae bacterium]|nr:EpsG family protein [Erysipelotrichaceae bacterium]
MLALRYGQGSDYFSYERVFNNFGSLSDVLEGRNVLNVEIGFQILCAVFPLDYRCFVGVISVFEMAMLYRYCRRYSRYPMVSLLIAFPTLYLTYYFSAIRQGIVLAVVLGILLPLMEKKQFFAYLIITILC